MFRSGGWDYNCFISCLVMVISWIIKDLLAFWEFTGMVIIYSQWQQFLFHVILLNYFQILLPKNLSFSRFIVSPSYFVFSFLSIFSILLVYKWPFIIVYSLLLNLVIKFCIGLSIGEKFGIDQCRPSIWKSSMLQFSYVVLDFLKILNYTFENSQLFSLNKMTHLWDGRSLIDIIISLDITFQTEMIEEGLNWYAFGLNSYI